MFLPSLNALALIIIGIVVLIIYFVKTRRVSTTEVTIIGVGDSSQLIRQRAPIFLALVLIVAGSALTYFEFNKEMTKEIEVMNIAIIDKHLSEIIDWQWVNSQSSSKGMLYHTSTNEIESALNLSILNQQIESEVADLKRAKDITSITNLETRKNSILYKLLRIYLALDKSKADALVLRYLDYYHSSIGGKNSFERWLSLEDFYSRHPDDRPGYINPKDLEWLEANAEVTELK